VRIANRIFQKMHKRLNYNFLLVLGGIQREYVFNI